MIHNLMCVYTWKLNVKQKWKENCQPQEHTGHSVHVQHFTIPPETDQPAFWVYFGYTQVQQLLHLRDTWWHQRPSSHGRGHFLLWYVRLRTHHGTNHLSSRPEKRENQEYGFPKSDASSLHHHFPGRWCIMVYPCVSHFETDPDIVTWQAIRLTLGTHQGVGLGKIPQHDGVVKWVILGYPSKVT